MVLEGLFGALPVVAIAANGLMAGLFFAFAVAVAPGLGRVDDGTFVRTFRAINAAILNPTFLSVFVGAPVASLAWAVARALRGGAPPLPLVVAGAVCSVLTFAITAAGNVPLNNQLDRAEVTTEEQCRSARRRFESRWNRLNRVRTVTSVVALGLLATAAALG